VLRAGAIDVDRRTLEVGQLARGDCGADGARDGNKHLAIIPKPPNPARHATV